MKFKSATHEFLTCLACAVNIIFPKGKKMQIKGCVRYKSSFRSRENQILEFYIFKFHDVIKCLNIKQEIHFTELLGN